MYFYLIAYFNIPLIHTPKYMCSCIFPQHLYTKIMTIINSESNQHILRYITTNLTIITLLWLIPIQSFAQIDPTQAQNVLNKHVALLKKSDNDLKKLCESLGSLNNQMVKYVDEDKNTTFPFFYEYALPEREYQVAAYQTIKLEIASKKEIRTGLDSLMATLTRIKTYNRELKQYLQAEYYKKDGMKQGFEYLKQLKRQFSWYFVRHEDLYTQVLNAWHKHKPRKNDEELALAIGQMKEAIGKAHQVYVSLRYDPDMSFGKEAYQNLQKALSELPKNTHSITKSQAYTEFTAPWPNNYLSQYGEKFTADFFTKVNNTFIAEVNKKLIINYNKVVIESGYPSLNIPSLPPMFGVESPKKPFTPEKEETKPEPIAEKPAPTTNPPKPEKPSTPNPPKPPKTNPSTTSSTPVKASALEGYAPSNMVLLVDVSGSMKRIGRLDTLKSSFEYLLKEMRSRDKVSIVTYSGKGEVILPPTPVTDSKRIMKIINELESEGESNLIEGLRIALTQVGKGYLQKGNNRIILATDGGLKIPASMKTYISAEATKGVSFSIFFFGSPNNPNIPELRNLAKIGNGHFVAAMTENAKQAMIREGKSIIQK